MADKLDLLSSEVLDPGKPVAGLDLLADPNAPGPFKRGFGAGVAGVKASLAGAGALAAHAVGAKELEQAALDKAAAESEIASQGAMQFEDVVKDPSRAGEYFKFLLGNAVPSLATMAVGGGLGALAGRAVTGAAGMAAARTAGVVAPAVRAGALVGAVAPDVALEAGGIYPEALKTGVENPALRAAAGGALAASLDFIPLLAAERYLKAAGKGGFGAMAKGAAKGAPVGAALEGTQEAGQALIERASAGKPLTDAEAVSDYINSFMGGAAPGTVFGAGIGAHRASTAPVQNQPGFTGREQPPEVNGTAENVAPIAVPPAENVAPVEPVAYPPIDQALAPPLDLLEPLADMPFGQTFVQPPAAPSDALVRGSVQSDGTVIPKEGSQIPKSGIIQTKPETEPEAVARAVKGVHALMREQGMPLATTQESLATPPKTAREAALDIVNQRIPKERVKVVNPADQVAEREARGIRTAQAAVEIVVAEKAKASLKDFTPAKQAALTRKYTDAVNSVVQEAAALPSIEERQARVREDVPKALAGLDKETREAVADEVAKTLYSKGAVIGDRKLLKALKGAKTTGDALRIASRLPTTTASERAALEHLGAFETVSHTVFTLGQATAFDKVVRNVTGTYNPEDAEVNLNFLADTPTLIHEATHAATVYALGEHVDDTGKTALTQLGGEILDVMSRARSATPFASFHYGFKNAYEFVAEANSNPRFQAALKAVSIDPGGKRTLWDMFKDWMRHLLKIPAAGRTAFDYAMDVVQYSAAENKGAMDRYMTGRAAKGFNSNAALTSDQFHALPQAAQNAAVDTYDKYYAKRGTDLIARVKEIVGDRAELRIKTFTAEPGQAIGSYTRVGPIKAIISMAVNAKNELSIADHEGYHAAEDWVLNAAERAIIANAFKPGKPLFELLMEKVRRYDVENKTNLADEVSSIPEEARAYGFEFWRRGELQADGALARVWAKIKEFFDRIANAVNGMGFQSLEDVFTALDRGQYAERAASDPAFAEGLALASEARRQEWYRSMLTEQVTALPTKAASAQGWKDQIKGLVAKGAVKQAEIDAVGLNEFLDLQQGKVTKDQVTAFLRENGVRVEETTLGAQSGAKRVGIFETRKQAEASAEMRSDGGEGLNHWVVEEPNGLFSVYGDQEATATKFATYQLPGGTNYRELVLSLPRKTITELPEGYTTKHFAREPFGGRAAGWGVVDATGQLVASSGMPGGLAFTQDLAVRGALVTMNRGEGFSGVQKPFRSTHFDQPNILAHIRFNERTDAEGKRVLFLEEIQSDWAQKGKKEGFAKGAASPEEMARRKQEVADIVQRRQAFEAAGDFAASNALGAEYTRAMNEWNAGSPVRGIPSAPFISSQKFGVFKEGTEMEFDAKADIAAPGEGKVRRFSTMAEAVAFAKKYSAEARDLGQQPDTSAWVGLSLKRVIRYAAENGFERVAWTNGSQQVERYKNALQNAVDRIEWTKTKDGVHLVGYKGPILDVVKDENLTTQDSRDRPWMVMKNGMMTHRFSTKERALEYAGDMTTRKVVDTTEKENAVSDAIGKTMADQIRNDPNEKGVIEGEDITISDTGMAGFYDKIVPAVANDVLKKLGGGRVGEVSVKTREPFMGGKYNIESDNVKYWLADSQTSAQIGPKYNSFIEADDARHAIYISESKGATPQPGFTITPELATRAAMGLPLFSKSATEGLTIEQVLKSVVDKERRERNGELEQLQENKIVAALIERAQSEPWMKTFARVGVSADTIAAKGGITSWWMDWMSTPNFISAFSKGFKNVYQVLNNFFMYRTVLVEKMLKEQIPEWYSASFADQDAATSALLTRSLEKLKVGSLEYNALLEPLSVDQKALFHSATRMIAGFLDAEFEMEQKDYKEFLTSPGAYDKWVADRAEQVQRLKDEGYVPFRRYGDYTVKLYKTVTDKDGNQRKETAGLQMFASEDDAIIAETFYRKEAELKGLPYTVERGIKQKNVREVAPSARQFIDTLRRQGVEISQAEREKLVLTLTDSDAIIRNRLMHREGIPGFSKDGERILNEFGVNMAAKLAYSKFASAMDAAAEGRAVATDVDAAGNANIEIDYRKTNEDGQYEPIEEYKARNLWAIDGPMSGYYYNRATKLFDAVLIHDHSGDWSRNLRSAGMMYFIGGSISGAVVNVMSVPMLLVPQLSIHTPYTNAVTTTLTAWKTTWQHQAILRDVTRLKDKENNPIPEIDNVPGLRAALIAAANKLQDTEIHQIMGISQGDLFARSRGLRRAMNVWMAPFRISEQTNRITSFIAAYKVGQKNGLTSQALFKFARDMVDATQNNYSLANRPGLANTPVGAMMFMFKSFPLFMIEAATLMYKASPRSAVFMLLGLTMMTGVQGLPFAETLENLIDTIAQRLFNSPFNTRRAMRNILKDASEAVVGYDLSELAMRGMINEILGVSASSRIGAGDFVPGSRLGTADADQGKILEQFLGAPYSMVTDALSNAGKFAGGVVTGDWKQAVDALRAGGPIAVRNAIKGVEQLDTGFAQDSQGRKIKDVGTVSAILQLGGMASAGVAKAYEFESINVQTKAFYTQVSQDLMHQTVAAMRAGDTEKLREINDLRTAWNQENPTMPIMPNPAALRRAAMLADMPMDRRSVIQWGRRLGGANIFNEMGREGM